MSSRADKWTQVISNELKMRGIIELIIQAEILCECGSPAENCLQSSTVQQAIRNECIKAFNAMFRDECEVTVVDAPYRLNIEGRTGSILFLRRREERIRSRPPFQTGRRSRDKIYQPWESRTANPETPSRSGPSSCGSGFSAVQPRGFARLDKGNVSVGDRVLRMDRE